MVLRTTGANWLALMMRAERAGHDRSADTAWLLYGPDDPDAVEREDDAPRSLAAEKGVKPAGG